ncbi:hypothetical protein M438DRAFT_342876 [Aureobasidium pullulans EXF-150]|uniref:Uncharacterized protein n=1 Tax=Aureobasidium pullulans EXF-150 TaxID=1043002 RepID=A0A074XQ77_AURPU|nr:uncharacterized protein M438DRAFT_342876 [Aureobasidium pullulans EXF-150]KEQ87743.1 hypothetical protein M438DRAFT_342876 [Aureobasidium pullulans EXF-150]
MPLSQLWHVVPSKIHYQPQILNLLVCGLPLLRMCIYFSISHGRPLRLVNMSTY